MASPQQRRQTPQRTVILEELCATDQHPTAAELFVTVRRRLPHISLGTVYRNLDVLSQAGAVRKLGFAGAEARFDGNMAPHDHARCTRCGIIRDVPPSSSTMTAPESAGLSAAVPDFLIEGRRLEYYGVCGACRNAGTN